MLDQEQVREILAETGVLHQGHFRLTSGKHSDTYLQCAMVLQHPNRAAVLGEALGAAFRHEQVGAVIGPATGAIILAYEVARALGTRALFTERENGVMVLRRGFTLQPGERVLVVEDVVTTGGSVQEVISVVSGTGGVPVGVGCIVDRSGRKAGFSIPLRGLITVNAQTWEPDECPLCRQGLPAVKPGSRQV